MNEKQKFNILKDAWSKCEEVIRGIAEKDVDGVEERLGKVKLDEILNFLEDIEFVKNNALTKNGKDYYQKKIILNNEDEARGILTESLKQYQPLQIICQILWGSNNLTKENMYHLLLSEGCITSDFKLSDLGSFVGLLNKCKILKYSRKFNKLTILYNPKIEPEEKPLKRFISPETPYSNIKALRECLRKCKEYIWWFDKQFSKRGLEPLSEEADGTKIKEIRILTGLTDNVNINLKRDFTRFQKETKNRGINAELHVICERDLFHDIHDRWIIGKNVCFNIPPINSIYKGQYAEIRETESIPPFKDWWSKGLDLTKDWQIINSNKIAKKI